MKSIISGAVLATAIVAYLSLTIQAKPVTYLSSTNAVALSDTGKMDKMKTDKMKTDKMEKKKMDKMSKGKMKADKKMDKMKKDTSGKM
jgi:thioester reductase-like protein